MLTTKLVWAGNTLIDIPTELGHPTDYQLAGNPGEQLCEIAARVRDNSLGTSSSTAALLWQSLKRDIGVFEHYNRTMLVRFSEESAAQTIGGLILFSGLFNRPGLWFRPTVGGFYLTLSTRTVLEWDEWTERLRKELPNELRHMLDSTANLGFALQLLWSAELPLIVTPPSVDMATALAGSHLKSVEFCSTDSPAERWVSIYIRGSHTGFHALRRLHQSVRKSHLCDESNTPLVQHPALRLLLKGPEALYLQAELLAFRSLAGRIYRKLVGQAASMLAGLGPAQALRQARGAAAGYLPGALVMDGLVSGTVAQWREAIVHLGDVENDAELRQLGVLLAETLRAAGQLSGLVVEEAPGELGHYVRPAQSS